MEAYTTNYDPKVIADYHIQCITRLGGCPERMRADNGTENGHVANMQVFLRRNHTDAFAKDNSFIYGRSTANQRIESWWGILRKQSGQFWMNMFKAIQDNGNFSGDFLDKSLIQFCFLDLVQVTHDQYKTQFKCNVKIPYGLIYLWLAIMQYPIGYSTSSVIVVVL